MIAHDSFYRHALDKDGRIVHVSEVTEDNRHDGYRCVSCLRELTPALGNKNVHHFRHKTDACSYESYIHKLWKQYIFEQWQSFPHLYVTYSVEHCCDKMETCKLFSANKKLQCSGIFGQETIDLKEKYDTCEIEGVYGGFRADLLLSNSHNPDIVPTFIEICYKHPCDEQKQCAGIPIIELKVTDDNLHLPQQLTEQPTLIPGFGKRPVVNLSVFLYGFNRERQLSHDVRRFRVYQDENGINHGKVDEDILSCHSLDEHLPDSMLEVFIEEDKAMSDSSLFEFGIRIASKNGIKIRHCLYCRYYGNRGRTCQMTMNGEKDSWLVNINDFSNAEFDKTNYTLICRRYYEWQNKNRVTVEESPHVVWKNNMYMRKPEKIPANVTANTNLKIQHLHEIALQHIQLK